jgi:hypothetical protein
VFFDRGITFQPSLIFASKVSFAALQGVAPETSAIKHYVIYRFCSKLQFEKGSE